MFWGVPQGRSGFLDVVLNLFLYTPIGFLTFHSLCSRGRGRRIAIATAAGLLMSVVIELVQGFDLPRDPSMSDVLCNGIGTLGGALFAAVWHHGIPPGSRYSPRPRAFRPAFLLVFWALF